MKLPISASVHEINDIRAPRWSTRHVLIPTYKIGEHNVIRFTQAPTMSEQYYVSSKVAARSNIENIKSKSGANIRMYAIPLSELVPYEGRNTKKEGINVIKTD